MKRLTSLLLSLTLLLGLAACGSGGTSESAAPSAQSAGQIATPAPTPDPVPTPETLQPPTSDGRVLVVYFSATNNTRGVAETIADTLDADIFELVPVEPYTSADLNYNDDNSRVSREHNDPSLQNISLEASTVDNWDEYDTIFVGYPIWWHAAAWPVNEFITENDFTGKTVIPFCTSGSSGLEDSGTKLRDMAGTGTWLEGQRFSGRASQSDVEDWVNSLGLSSGSETQEPNTLVVYFSMPETPYPTDHETLVDLARDEQGRDFRPVIKDTVDNMDSYDVIYLGYPNWWGDMPMILYSFLEQYDLSGKTIVPFNTHGGSGFSNTISTIAELQPNATVVQDGLTISRNHIQDAEQEIIDWVQGLG